MEILDIKSIPVPKLHGLLLGAVAPRPICFASTIDVEGNVNLSPFSFFNIFGSNPPTLIFSPARRGRDNTTKHTLENVKEMPEVVVNIVNYTMVQQMSLASTEYPKGVNEFLKAGFTMEPAKKVKPPRVKESPVQLECIVKNVIETGNEGGAGNLVIAEIVALHIQEHVLDEKGNIDPYKIDQVARLGADWYTRANKGLFEVEKPLHSLGIGVDRLPKTVFQSTLLTGNDLGRLGNLPSLPNEEQIKNALMLIEAEMLKTETKFTSAAQYHAFAKHLINNNQIQEALAVLASSPFN